MKKILDNLSGTISILGDCMEVMSKLPDKCFDLAVVDPPYFSGPESRRFYGTEFPKNGFRRKDYPVTPHWLVPSDAYFEELLRVSKHQIVWGCNYFPFYLGPGRIIWDKVNGGSSFSDCEQAYCSFHESTRLFRFMWNGGMQGKSISEGWVQKGDKTKNEKRIHPTQKPVALYRWIFQKYADPGMKILDTHLGSGSSRIAAKEANLQFLGIELDAEHFARQEKRFKDYVSQGNIFDI